MTSISIFDTKEFPKVPLLKDTSENVENVTSVPEADVKKVLVSAPEADVEKVPQIVTEADVKKVPISVSEADAAADANTSTGFFDEPANGDIYEVERLCSRKMINGKEYYLVKWTGWASAHNTWEPTENLIGSDVKKMMQKWAGSAV